FTTDNDTYVFDVAANYQNEQLSRQKIWLNKKTLAPKQVQVSDANHNVLVQVNFTSFEFDAKFDKDFFQMERNMTSWNLKSLPTMAGAADANHPVTGGKSVTDKNLSATGGQSDQAAGQAQEGQKSTATKTGTDTTKSTAAASKPQSIGIIEPSYLPKDVVKQDITDMKLGEDAAVLLRYKGKYNFSLIEVRPQAKSVSLQPGTIVDLGFTIGVLTGDEKKTLTWTNDGVEFRLSTGDLPTNEMIKVAMATEGQSGK
ncbi:outer membrane lipoprotein carrier protein LolA, partial [Bacillus tropicus]